MIKNNLETISGNSYIKSLKKKKSIKDILVFIKENNLKQKLLSETSWFLLANMIFSASTYIVGILVPYILNTDYLAWYTSGNQILLVLSFIFEFGLSISFLRYYKLDNSSRYLNSFIQIILFIFIIACGYFFGPQINSLFNLDNLPVDYTILYVLVISQLSWIFVKNWLLAINKLKTLLFHSILIFILRILLLIHLFYIESFSLTQLFVETLLLPFIPTILHLGYININVMIEGLKKYGRIIPPQDNLFKHLYEYIQYSALTYISGFIYLYSGRYFIIYLTGKNNVVLADVGYSMTFIGILLVFYTSIRNYLISRLRMDNLDFIHSYIKALQKMSWLFLIGSVVISLLFSYIVFLIMPEYLTLNAVIFAFILFMTRVLLIYTGLFTVLSKTFAYNKLELILNIIRLTAIVLITHFLLDFNIILGIVLIHIVQLGIELLFAQKVIRKIKYAI